VAAFDRGDGGAHFLAVGFDSRCGEECRIDLAAAGCAVAPFTSGERGDDAAVGTLETAAFLFFFASRRWLIVDTDEDDDADADDADGDDDTDPNN